MGRLALERLMEAWEGEAEVEEPFSYVQVFGFPSFEVLLE